MAITFYVADNIKEVRNNGNFVIFYEDIYEFLKNSLNGSNAELLLGLDRDGDKIFSTDEIKQLQGICRQLVNLYTQEEKIINFANKLIDLCSLSMTTGKSIIAFGD